MILSVFGANGRVGTLVVTEALRRGHHVRAFVHSRDPFEASDHLTVLKGEVTDADLVDRAVEGSGAIISTLGTFRRGSTPIMTEAVRLITRSMTRHAVGRLVVLTGAGVVDPGRKTPARTHLNRLILRVMDRSAVPDVDAAMQILRASSVDHSTLCAPTITPTGPSGYELIDTMPSLSAKIAGPAVAAALLDLTETPGRVVCGIRVG